MSDEQKPKPIEDLKEGLGLLFRAAKGAVEKLPTDKVEDVAKDAVKEVGRAFETIGGELDKMWNKATGSERPGAQQQPGQQPAADASGTASGEAREEKKEEKKEEPPFDDAYAPEPPPKGPRVG